MHFVSPRTAEIITRRVFSQCIVVCLVLIGAFGQPITVMAQCPAAAKVVKTVKGQVLGSSGGLADVTVTLTEEANNVSWSTKTDGSGRYSFGQQNLCPKITVTVQKSGYKFVPPTAELNVPGAVLDDVNFAAVADDPDPVVRIVEGMAQPMNSRMITDRFGRVLDNQYHGVKIDIFNKLADIKNQTLVGDSIVVSSSSVQLPVNWEVKYIGRRNTVSADRRDWHPLELMRTSSANISQPLNWTAWENDLDKRKGEAERTLCLQRPSYETPYSFDEMVGTVDRRDSKSWRGVALTSAESAATLTSFVTSFIVPVNTNDAPTILDKFKNLLIPSFKENFPSLKDEHRKNLTSDTMRALETVAFKDHLPRTVFIPRGEMKAGEWAYRISQICRDKIKIEAVVAKSGDQLPIQMLSGKVTDDETNAPVPNARVQLAGASLVPFETLTDANGLYTLFNLPSGNYSITVADPLNCNRAKSEAVTVGAANVASPTANVKDLKLPAMFTVTGTVTTLAGAPILTGVSVDLMVGGIIKQNMTSRPDGTFEFKCVPKGDYKLRGNPAGGVTFTETNLPAASLSTPQTVRATT